MPVEMAKCWWLLKIEPNVWAGCKGSCAVCVDLQAVEALEFFGELYSLAKGFGPILRGFGEKGRVLFLVTTSTSPSLQAYAELHALFSEGVYKPLAVPVWEIKDWFQKRPICCACAHGLNQGRMVKFNAVNSIIWGRCNHHS